MSIRQAVSIGLTLSVLGFVATPSARADEQDHTSLLTFNQPMEIPGHVLPAGTYLFKLADSASDRQFVQVFNEDGSQLIATVITIPDYRLTSTGRTFSTFDEVPSDSVGAMRAWFSPGNAVAYEFVYPTPRAKALARASKAVVPATSAVDDLKTASIMAITAEEQETTLADAVQTTPLSAPLQATATPASPAATPASPVPTPASPMMTMPATPATEPATPVMAVPANPPTAATQTTPPPMADSSQPVGTTGVEPTARPDAQLPSTASNTPFIVMFGVAAIGIGLGLRAFGKRASASSH
jgi:hypothetical protein